MNQFANQYVPPAVGTVEQQLWARVNYLLGVVGELKAQVAQVSGSVAAVPKLQTQVVAASDALTQLSTFVGKGATQFNSNSVSVVGSGVGLALSGASGAVVITVTSGPTLRTAIGAADASTVALKASPAIVAATVPLAKITGGGTDGSITVNVEGIVTGYVLPT